MYEKSATQRQFRIPNIIIKITMHPLRISKVVVAQRIRVMPPRRGGRDGVIGLHGALPRCDGEWMDWECCFSWHYGHRFRSPANGGCKSVSLGIQFALLHIAETAEFSLFAVCHYCGIPVSNCALVPFFFLKNKTTKNQMQAHQLWGTETAGKINGARMTTTDICRNHCNYIENIQLCSLVYFAVSFQTAPLGSAILLFSSPVFDVLFRGVVLSSSLALPDAAWSACHVARVSFPDALSLARNNGMDGWRDFRGLFRVNCSASVSKTLLES